MGLLICSYIWSCTEETCNDRVSIYSSVLIYIQYFWFGPNDFIMLTISYMETSDVSVKFYFASTFCVCSGRSVLFFLSL